jgi:peptidoglycan/LPS O-acetylase OafA/YrhL
MSTSVAGATDAATPRDSQARAGRYGALLGCAAVLLAVQGIAPAGPVQQVAVAALAGCCLVLAVRAARLSPTEALRSV